MRHTHTLTALAILALTSPSTSQAESRWTRAAKWTAAAVAVSSAADAATSWGRPELHPALGPRFGYRGLAIKSAGTMAYLAVQHIRGRRNPANAKVITLTNIVVAGVFTGAAVYNWQLGAARVGTAGPKPIIITPGWTRITWTPCPDPTCGGVF